MTLWQRKPSVRAELAAQREVAAVTAQRQEQTARQVREALATAREATARAAANGRRLAKMEALLERHCNDSAELLEAFRFSRQLRRFLVWLLGGLILIGASVGALEPIHRAAHWLADQLRLVR